ncbi:MAG: four helix bundle protein [Pyrinomonadaceae bacterium]
MSSLVGKAIYQLPFLSYHFSLTPCAYATSPKRMEDQVEKNPQLRANELEERLIDFVVRIVRLSANLPRTAAGKHIAGQIMRSGTSPAPNYGEARGAESQTDFVHKLAIVLKELNETSIWLRIIGRSGMLRERLIAQLVQENNELCKILTASLKTARGRPVK